MIRVWIEEIQCPARLLVQQTKIEYYDDEPFPRYAAVCKGCGSLTGESEFDVPEGGHGG